MTEKERAVNVDISLSEMISRIATPVNVQRPICFLRIVSVLDLWFKTACDMHILVPPLRRLLYSAYRLSRPCNRHHGKLCCSGVRLSSQPMSCDSSRRVLSSSRRLGFGEVQRQSDASHYTARPCCYLPQRVKANNDAGSIRCTPTTEI